MSRKPYISIDIETTGLDPDTCQILEIGAVIDNWILPIKELPRFQCYIVDEPVTGSHYALSMHPKILRRIANREPGFSYAERSLVTDVFLYWLKRHGIDPRREHITPAGKNYASFDKQFLDKLPDWKEIIKSNHRCIDPGNLYWHPEKDWGLPSTEVCMERAGITGEVTHTAVEDALIVVKLIRNIKGKTEGKTDG